MQLLRWVARLWFSLLAATLALLALAIGARLLLASLPLPTPDLVATTPDISTAEVLPISQLTLRFSQPMNRASVAQALRISPSQAGTLIWHDGGRTVVFSPTQLFQPSTTYRLTLDARATSWLYQPLAREVALEFRTSPAPTVITLLPPDQAHAVAPRSLLSIGFSRPMIPPELVGRELTLPELQIEPPLEHRLQWLNQSTLLIRPLPTLQPATPYSLTIEGALRDLSGSPLGQPLRWHFRTAAPEIRDRLPAVNSRGIALAQPLTISLTQPLDLAALEAALTISPTVSGQLVETRPPRDLDVAQVISFVPASGWAPSTSYSVTLPAGIAPAVGSLPLAEGASWSFRTVDAPRLSGRFPGEDQTLPLNQDLRLAFTTAVDPQALAAVLSLEPPVEGLNVRSSGGEVRIGGPLRPSTAYTLTLPATLTDTNGVALGREYRLRFLTAPAPPTLQLPQVAGHFLTLPADVLHRLTVEHVNISGLELALYDLDEATLVRTLSFGDEDWLGFTPERYGRSQLARLPLALSAPLDTAISTTINLSLNDSQPGLAPGAYYLRVTSAEGPRLDLVVAVSRLALALTYDAEQVIVWATENDSQAVSVDLPLTLYQGDVIIARGRSDSNGLWQVAHPRRVGDAAYVVVSGDQFGIVSGLWLAASETTPTEARSRLRSYQGLLFTDRPVYQPGDEVALQARVRRLEGTSRRWPDDGEAITLQARSISGTTIYRERLALQNGVAGATFALPADLAAGSYLLQASIGDTRIETGFTVVQPDADLLRVTIQAPQRVGLGEELTVRTQTTTPLGRPVAGVVVNWKLSCPLTEADPGRDRAFDPQFSAFAALARDCTDLEGSAQSDTEGRLNFSLQLPMAAGRYQIRVWAEEAPGIAGSTTTIVEALPALQVVPTVDSRILAAGDPISLTVRASDLNNQPVSQSAVEISLLRWTTAGNNAQAGPTEQVLRRRVTTDAAGEATLRLAGQPPGSYRLVVKADGAVTSESSLPLWVSRPGFTAWPRNSEAIAIVSDKPAYRAGDIATVLPLLPANAEPALLLRMRQGNLGAEVRPLQAGVPITLGLGSEDAPELTIWLVTPARDGSGRITMLSGATSLAVDDDVAALRLSIQTDQASYAPGATAVLTVSVIDVLGRPQDAELDLLATTGAPGLAADAIQQALGGPYSVDGYVAHSLAAGRPGRAGTYSGAITAGRSSWAANEAPGQTILWRPALRVVGGRASLRLELPETVGPLQIAALAASDAERWGQISTTLLVSQPWQITPLLPTFLRRGDEIAISARIGNSLPISQNISVRLEATGIVPGSGSNLTQQIGLAPNSSQELHWAGSAGTAPEAVTRFSIQGDDGTSIQTTARLPIQPSSLLAQRSGGGLAAPQFGVTGLGPPDSGTSSDLEIVLSPSLQGALLELWHQLERAPSRNALLEADTLLAGAALVEAKLLLPQRLEQPLNRLLAVQQTDGGWGWRQGDASLPLVSGQVALALGSLDERVIPQPAVDNLRGYLRRALQASAEPNLRTIVVAGLSSLDPSQGAAIRELSRTAELLQTDTLALLTIAARRSNDSATADRLSRLLRERARPNGNQIFWPVAVSIERPLNSLTASALALQALAASDPDSAQIAPARDFLLTRYTADGWGNSYATARAIAALAERLPEQGADYRYIVAANGVELVSRNVSSTMTETQRIVVERDQLQANSTVTIERDGTNGDLMVGYRVDAALPGPASGGLAIQRSYLDPHSGELLNLAELQAGQLVSVRLILVAPQDVGFVVLDDPLPAGITVLRTNPTPSVFSTAEVVEGRLRAYAVRVPAGIVELHYTARIEAAGTFTAPAPSAYLAFEPSLRGTGTATRLIVRPSTRFRN